MSNEYIPDITTFASPPRHTIDYRAVEKEQAIGRGGQAAVYQVTLSGKSGPDRVALKEPLQSGTLSRAAQEAFLDEAKNWELVDRLERQRRRWNEYEHIVGVVDTGDQLPWIAMEYMDGGSVAELLESNPDGITVERALWIAKCVARGLEIAHENGIAHLDLTPGNILLKETGSEMWDVPKIADWGLARLLARETGTMEALSPRYAAPEQFDPDEYGQPDTMTDVYQLGAVLYAMLTGDPPYTGSRLSVMRSVVDGDSPPSVRDRCGDIPYEVEEVVTQTLSATKSDRFATVTEFQAALHDAFVATQSTEGSEPASVDRTSRAGQNEDATVTDRAANVEGGTSIANLSRVSSDEARNLKTIIGISTIKELATIDEYSVARRLDRSPNEISRWKGEAKTHLSSNTDQNTSERTDSMSSKRVVDSSSQSISDAKIVPYYDLNRVSKDEAKMLASVGITNLRDLAEVNDIEVGRRLDRSPNKIARWRENARNAL